MHCTWGQVVWVGDLVGSLHCVFRKTINSHSAFLYQGVLLDTNELSGKPDEMLEGDLVMD